MRRRSESGHNTIGREPIAIDLESLETLLEEALRKHRGEAIFLAATLVETLFEHFDNATDHISPPHRVAASSGDGILRLAHHLPSARTFNLEEIQLQVGCTLDHVHELLCGEHLQLAPLPTTGNPYLLQWVQQYPCLTSASSHKFRTVVAFTDGSFDGLQSSWAFHAVGDTGTTQVSLGWIGDITVVDPHHPAFIGAKEHGALPGELSAIFWCIVWLLPLSAETDVTIYSDCTVAISLSAGKAGQYRGADLATRCREVMQAIVAKRGSDNIALQHIKSHVGHHGNEIADYLAKCCCKGQKPLPVLARHPVATFVQQGWLTWLWLLIEIQKSPTSWPTHVGGCLADPHCADAPLPTRAECEDMLGLRPNTTKKSADNQEGARLWATFLTVNVQSLQAEEDKNTTDQKDDNFPGRAGLLRAQLDQLGVSVAALQETRAPRSETIQSKTHVRFCSARDEQGSFGTEIWFSKLQPFIWHDVAPVRFCASDFLVVHWDPRIVAVRFFRGSLRLLFVSLHAPTNLSPARNQWWQDLRLLLARIRQGSQVILLGDFNLHLHQAHGDRVGELTWATKHPPPEIFWDTLDVCDLWIPSTFGCCHTGPSATWRAPGGTSTSRLDYVALPSAWQVPEGGSWVAPELDWGQSNPDHFALCVAVRADIRFGQPPCGRQPRLDVQAMRTPEGKEKIQTICASMPEQPWHIDVHRHASAIETHFGKYLPVAFPPPKARKAKAYLQQDTWQVRNQRAWLRKRVHKETHRCECFTVKEVRRPV